MSYAKWQRFVRTVKHMVSPWHAPKRPSFPVGELDPPRFKPKPQPPVERKTPESEFLKELRAAVQRNTIDYDTTPPPV